MTFSILSGPELGISRWPLQIHTLPSASTCPVSWENAVWATPTGSGLAGSISGAEEQREEESEWETLFPCCLSASGELRPSTDSLAPQAALSSQLSPGSGSCSHSCPFKPGGGDSTLFYFFNICLFIWPHRVLVMAPRIFAASCRTFRCCIWTLCLWRGLWYLQLTGSVVVAYSSPCGILSSSPRNRARVSCIAGWILHHWAIGKFCHSGFLTNETVYRVWTSGERAAGSSL